MKIEKGDLVKCVGCFNNRVGIVKAVDDKEFWCIKDHADVDDCIVPKKNLKIIKKHVVPVKYLKDIV